MKLLRQNPLLNRNRGGKHKLPVITDEFACIPGIVYKISLTPRRVTFTQSQRVRLETDRFHRASPVLFPSPHQQDRDSACLAAGREEGRKRRMLKTPGKKKQASCGRECRCIGIVRLKDACTFQTGTFCTRCEEGSKNRRN